MKSSTYDDSSGVPATPERALCGSVSANEAELVCAEAYQVVGSLLEDLGQFDSELGQKILDNLSEHRLVHKDVLPWPSFKPAPL